MKTYIEMSIIPLILCASAFAIVTASNSDIYDSQLKQYGDYVLDLANHPKLTECAAPNYTAPEALYVARDLVFDSYYDEKEFQGRTVERICNLIGE